MRPRPLRLAGLLAALAVALAVWIWDPLAPPPPPPPPIEPDVTAVLWQGCGVPEAVWATETFPVLARFTNAGDWPWPHAGVVPIRLALRLRDANGELFATGNETRVELEADLAPGAEAVRWLEIRAPRFPGHYTVELDVIPATASRLDRRSGPTCRAEVAVVSPDGTDDEDGTDGTGGR